MAQKTDRDTFARKVRLLDLLPDGTKAGRTVTELRGLLESEGYIVSARTIERDLNELASFGRFQLRRSAGKPASWSWQPRCKRPHLLGMDVETALLYNLLQRFLAPLLPKSLYSQLIPTFTEATQKLSTGSKGQLANWRQRVAVDQAGQPLLLPGVQPQVQHVISDALLKSKQCEFDYRSPNGADDAPTKRPRVAPAGIVLRDGVQYLICTFEGGRQVYSYALHRMSSPKLLEAPANIPPDFDLERHIIKERAIDIPNGGPIKLELRVRRWWGEFLSERRLAQDQVISDILGSEDKRVTATVAATEQLRWWLLSLGSSVEVVRPAELREMMAKETAAMTRQYRRRKR